MTDAITRHVRSYRLPHGFDVEFTCTFVVGKPIELQAAWTPHVPKGHAEWQPIRCAYVAARCDYLAEIARAIGGNVLCVEV